MVLARTGDAETAIDLPRRPAAQGVTLTQQITVASDTQYRVELDGVGVTRTGSAPRAAGWDVDPVMRRRHHPAGRVGGRWRHASREITTQYAKDREQFDKPLGAFQAIAHYLADAKTASTGRAPWCTRRPGRAGRAADRAPGADGQALRLPDVPRRHRHGQQIFGGVGFTVEYDIQLYFRRAKALQISWWDHRYLEELVAADVLDTRAQGRPPSTTGLRQIVFARSTRGVELEAPSRRMVPNRQHASDGNAG